MEQFEYKRVFYEHGCQISDLNNEGNNGWELCEIERQCGAREYVIFKKKKVYNDNINQTKDIKQSEQELTEFDELLLDMLEDACQAVTIKEDALFYLNGNKDKLLSAARKQIKNEIDLLLDSIDHAYLNPDGTYNDLALEVVDKVKYLKLIRRKQ